MACTEDRIKTVRWVYIGNRTVLQDVTIVVQAGDSPVCICEMGRTSNNNRNRCTLGVRARRMPYSCDRAIGWYVWKVTVRLKSACEEPYGECRGMKPVRDKISFRRDGSTVRYSKRVERKSYGILQLSRRLGFGEKDAQACGKMS